MSQVPCPRCDENIRVPEAVPPADASARCPWCRETFSFGEIEDRLPPMLEWVGSDGQPIPYSAGTLVGSAAAASGFHSGPEAGPAYSDHQDDSGQAAAWTPESEAAGASYDFEDSDSQAGLAIEQPAESDQFAEVAPVGGAASFDTSSPRASRRTKKSSSPLKTMIQMVLGGAVAIPLTGLILFGVQSMGWKTFNFGFWPFDGSGGGPTRTAAPPMDISDGGRPSPEPRELGGGELPFGTMGGTNSEQEFVPRSVDDTGIAEIATPEPEISDPGLSVPELSEDLDSATGDPLVMPEVAIPSLDSDVPSPFASPTADASPDAVAEVTADPVAMELPAPASDSSAANDSTETSPDATAASAPDAGSPALEPPALPLLDAVESARNLSTDLAEFEGDAEGRRELLKNFYYALAEVGERGQPSAKPAYQSLFTQLRDAGQLEPISKFGSPWVAKGNLVKNGVFAAGTLEEQDGETVLVMAPYKSEAVSLPLDGWAENQVDSEQWIGKKVFVLAKLEGPIGSRQGTVRYIEGQ